MKILKVFSILLVMILVAFYSIGIFKKQISIEYTIDIQAPINKAWNALASHEFKTIIYPNINANTAKVEDFKQGNTTYLEYQERGTSKYISEFVKQKDSLELVVLELDSKNSLSVVEQHFINRNLVTRVHIKESIQGKTIVERAMLFLFQKAMKKNKIQLFTNLKTKIESTPDFNFRVSEQK